MSPMLILKSARAVALIAAAIALQASAATGASITEVKTGRPDLTVFLLDGAIVGGETLNLQGLISKLPVNTSVAMLLNSPGGSLDEGLKLGRFFHQARLPTFVRGYGGGCHSACSLAFLGGRDKTGRPSRTKMSSGALGFHQFRSVRSTADNEKKYTKADVEQEVLRTRFVALKIIEYLSDIGEEMSPLHLMLKAPAAEMNFISNEEALTYGINVMNEKTEQVIDSSSIKARIGAR